MVQSYRDCLKSKEVIMVDLHTILADHQSRPNQTSEKSSEKRLPVISEIPDLFFDQILVNYKLTRIEIMVLMYIYRRVWCRPNLYKLHGISQLMSHSEMADKLGPSLEEIYHALRKLEEYNFIATVRSGQYFVRKFFTKDYDEFYGQTYDDFEL